MGAAELKQLMEEQMAEAKSTWATDNACTADDVEVVGAGNLSRPYECMDKCPADMPFRCKETMQCHDCTDATLGEKAGMMELVNGECKPVAKDNKKNDDNKKKDNNKKGGNKKGGNKKNNNKKNEEKKEEKMAAREAWAATHDCVTGADFEVLGDGKKVPFACAATCPDETPYRCHKTQQCHDCTATTLNEFAEFYKLTTVSKTDEDGTETTMDKCLKAKIGKDITEDRAAELKQLMEEQMAEAKSTLATDNDCTADDVEVVGAGNLSRPYECMDKCL